MAQKYLKEALEMAPNDPFVLHELGVIAFQSHRYGINIVCIHYECNHKSVISNYLYLGFFFCENSPKIIFI